MARIYIVEDDKNIREIESFALKNSGYSVYDFECAKDFYEKLSAFAKLVDNYSLQTFCTLLSNSCISDICKILIFFCFSLCKTFV